MKISPPIFRGGVIHHAAGRTFIDLYWWLGPSLARHVRRHPCLAAYSRAALSQLVAIIRRNVLKGRPRVRGAAAQR